jgi:hypothetical protein
MDWFERLTGFAEREPAFTRGRLNVIDGRLHSKVNGRSHGVGWLELVSLEELRLRTRDRLAGPGRIVVADIRGDVRQMHLHPDNAAALFQVASQFNLLEMASPEVTPEDGVTRYQHDHTQGPACAMAAGAATIFRNYFAPLGGRTGQTAEVQINCLDDLGAAFGHATQPVWTYRNGYVLCSAEGLARIGRQLAAASSAERDRLRGRLKVGLHWDVEVTDSPTAPGPRVSQVFCSALPVAYSDVSPRQWEPFARLVLEAAYEATVLAGVLNRARVGGSKRILLTRLGGGAFGNEPDWIDAAISRALQGVAGAGLEVLHVSR